MDLTIKSKGIGEISIPAHLVGLAVARMKSAPFRSSDIASIIAEGLRIQGTMSPAALRVAKDRGPDRLIQRERQAGNIRLEPEGSEAKRHGGRGGLGRWVWIGADSSAPGTVEIRVQAVSCPNYSEDETFSIEAPAGLSLGLIELIAQGLIYRNSPLISCYEILLDGSSLGVFDGRIMQFERTGHCAHH